MLPGILRAAMVAMLIWLSTLASAAEPEPALTFHAGKLAQIDAAISLAISDGRCPGGVVWIERRGAAYHRALGDRALEPEREPMTEDTVFDAASLTKVIATTTAVMKLVEQGRVALDAQVSDYLPEFRGSGKEAITVRQLLTHTSGLRAGLSGTPEWSGADGALMRACAEPLPAAPGSMLRYSDINFILLGELVGKVGGQPLDVFCAAEIFAPLRMADTAFRPAESLRTRIAPTARGTPLGVVHDPTARRMGGVAGHAGLFTTASDLARFARMLLGRGTLDGVRILNTREKL